MSKKAMGHDPLGFIKNTINDDEKNKIGQHKSGHKKNPDNISKPSNRSTITEINASETALLINKGDCTTIEDRWIRATYIVKDQLVDQIKAVAYWERKNLKEVINEALTLYLSKKNVQCIPPINSNVLKKD